jgi:uncharacterized protein YlxW (UPF0749 family)
MDKQLYVYLTIIRGEGDRAYGSLSVLWFNVFIIEFSYIQEESNEDRVGQETIDRQKEELLQKNRRLKNQLLRLQKNVKEKKNTIKRMKRQGIRICKEIVMR